MSQTRGIGRPFSDFKADFICSFGGSITFWVFPGVKPVVWMLWPTGSLDLKTTVWSLCRATTCGTKTQFFWSTSTVGDFETRSFSASGFVPLGFTRKAQALRTPFVLGSTTRSSLLIAETEQTSGFL